MAKKITYKDKINKNIKDYIIFYNKNLKKKHIKVFILTIIIFFVCISLLMNNLDTAKDILTQTESIKAKSSIFSIILKEKILLIFLLVFSGITPFIYIPVVGMVIYPYILAINIINKTFLVMIFAVALGIIQLFIITLAISAGIYYCNVSTKRFRYDQMPTISINDIKLQIYETAKNEEKINKTKEKIRLKKEKKEKLNVKIEYKYLFKTAVIASGLIVILTLITGV